VNLIQLITRLDPVIIRVRQADGRIKSGHDG
jgi:hypothetical protein